MLELLHSTYDAIQNTAVCACYITSCTAEAIEIKGANSATNIHDYYIDRNLQDTNMLTYNLKVYSFSLFPVVCIKCAFYTLVHLGYN